MLNHCLEWCKSVLTNFDHPSIKDTGKRKFILNYGKQ